MNDHPGPVYEVTLEVDREVAGDIDGWLAAHVQEMLAVPGISAARTYALDDSEERVRRVTAYYFESDELLSQYLDGPAQVLRRSTSDRFGERFEAHRRILRDPDAQASGPASVERCLNCDAPLAGQYCGQCGQRARNRLISLWELIRDAFGDLFELDSRLWRTLIPLSIRPGRLTDDYLRGKRARYMPPFRMYIVLSLAFFVIAFFDPREEFGILFEPNPPETVAEELPEAAEMRREFRRQVLEDFGPDEDSSVEVTINGEEARNCNFDDYDPGDMPAWLARRLTKQRLQLMCERLFTDDGTGLQGFTNRMIENVPIGLFILLPMMALLLKVLYPLSKRYYVEHLLFVLHYHAFVFLALTLQILFARAISAIRGPEGLGELAAFLLTLYIPVYLYKSLRQVYRQGHLATLAKFLMLGFGYAIGLALIIGVTAVFVAFSV